jgi:translocation and assembly module TamB
LRGSVRFSERGAELRDVSGSIGGGQVEVAGNAGYSEGRLTSVDLQLTGRRVALRYTEGLRSVLDLDLRLFGDAARQWLSGSIDVRHALWTRRYDLASELLAAGAAVAPSASLREGLRYDIAVRAPGTLEVDNNLATLRARAELQVAGSSEAPVLLGRAEVERGRVYFQGNTYTIRRGTIDFTNPQRIDPAFNIQAETRIRSYRVNLDVNGTLERVYPTLSSDPPLSAVQIVNLLAGADETQVASLTQSQSEQARMAAAGAATLAAGRISEEVGLERQAERLFGINRFSIDPSLVKGDVANPTARITVGKRITPDLNVLYSIDLKGGQEQLLSVEYSLSDRFSILFTSSEPGGLGLDVRVRQSR